MLPTGTVCGMSRQCEVCGAGLRDWVLRGGGVLFRCPDCAHVERDLAACPAGADGVLIAGTGFLFAPAVIALAASSPSIPGMRKSSTTQPP